MHGAGGHGKGFPSCLSVSMGNAAVVESNNAPSISTLMRVFFIDFFSLVCKNYQLSVSTVLPYHTQSIGFTGNFRIWNRFFPNWEYGGGGDLSAAH
jgi:hypothetical protein